MTKQEAGVIWLKSLPEKAAGKTAEEIENDIALLHSYELSGDADEQKIWLEVLSLIVDVYNRKSEVIK
jgi:hypothetical protein